MSLYLFCTELFMAPATLCDECGGKVQLPRMEPIQWRDVCRTCGGDGKTRRMDCATCDGLGHTGTSKLYLEETCGSCNGSGSCLPSGRECKTTRENGGGCGEGGRGRSLEPGEAGRDGEGTGEAREGLTEPKKVLGRSLEGSGEASVAEGTRFVSRPPSGGTSISASGGPSISASGGPSISASSGPSRSASRPPSKRPSTTISPAVFSSRSPQSGISATIHNGEESEWNGRVIDHDYKAEVEVKGEEDEEKEDEEEMAKMP